MLIRIVAALGAVNLALLAPLAAAAQDVPSYAQAGAPQNDPAAAPSYATQDQQVHGRVISFDGGYALRVRDDRGYVDNVALHQGTVINPTGLTLASGMVVSIHGYNQGAVFAANEIDTPYTFSGAVPYYGGYPWYHYGPSVSLGFFFGNTGWWNGGYYGGPYGYGYRPYGPGPYYYGGGYGNGGYPAPVYHGGYRRTLGAPGGYRSTQGGQGGYRSTQASGGYRSTQGSQGGSRSTQGAAHPNAQRSGGGDRHNL